MIEVEQKFKLQPGDEQKLIDGAEFVREVRMTDTYYDTADFVFTLQDKWLRKRNDAWELKLPMHRESIKDRRADQYTEVENETEIRAAMHLLSAGTMEEALQAAGLQPFCTYTTIRRKYKKGELTIDVDQLDYGHQMTEIEKMVTTEAEIDPAIDEILAYARTLDLEQTFVRDKTSEWIRRNNPEHFQKLQAAGIV